jgi:hypothetical protein
MRTYSTCFAIALAFGLASTPAAARQVVEQQTIQINTGSGGGGSSIQLPPGFGGPRQFKTGTGRIRGRVLGVDSAVPIRRAQVRISGTDIAPKSATTDADGRFEFGELPAGRFTVQASKPGFVSVQYGQTRPFEQGKAIELVDKQSMDKADIVMPRGSVISGRIVDEFGDPVPDVSVTAMRQSWANGRRRLAAAGGRLAQTNDLGQFRLYGLPPGEYYVSASTRGSGMPLGEMEYTIVTGAVSGPFGAAAASEPKTGYAATYYPGTPNPGEAQRISLGAGQEMSGADFSLVPVRLAKVSGIVIGSDGKPLEGAALTLASPTRDLSGLLGMNSARTARDGSFTINSVPPGEYSLQARGVQVITSTQGDNMMVFRATAIGGGGDGEFGSTPVSVGGEDVANLMLVTSKGAVATGRVIFDGTRPNSITSLRVMSAAIDADGPGVGGGGSASVKEDGAFELKGLAGPRLIRMANLPPGWTLKSVKVNGTDITDSGADFKPGDAVSGVEIELTQKVSSVAGTVTAADGSLLKDYTVVVFAESPELWRMPMTRWVSGTRPDQDGRFKMPNLPAGTYYAIAVDYLPQGEWGDPELLDRLRPKAKRFTLTEGAAQTLDLRLTGDY